MSQLSFKSQGLKVDWIGFNCQKLSESGLKEVALFLLHRGFNSTLTEKKDQEWRTSQLMTHQTNHSKVEFQQHSYQQKDQKHHNQTLFFHKQTSNQAKNQSIINQQTTGHPLPQHQR